MKVARANSDQPTLSVRILRAKAITRRKLMRSHFKRSRLDVNRNELSPVVRLDQRANFTLVYLVAAAGELLLAVTGTSSIHRGRT